MKSRHRDNEYFILGEKDFYYYLKDVEPKEFYKFKRIGDTLIRYTS